MAIRYLILALTQRCNLNCRYCYNEDAQAPADMSEAVMRAAVDLAVSGEAPFHLQLTGGEPTLVPDRIRMAAALAQESGRCAGMALQTNATKLTPELLKWLKKNRFQMGVSLDGPPAVQERLRGAAADTFKGIMLLDAAGIEFRVTTVLSGENALFLDRLVLTLAGFAGIRGIGLDLLIEKGRARCADGLAHADKATLETGLGAMLRALDAVNAHRQIPIRLRERDLIASAVQNAPSAFCHACRGESMAVLPDGRIFPCGQTLGDPFFAAGTVWDPRFENLNALEHCRPPDAPCDGCVLESICPGECPSRLHYNRCEHPARICDLYRVLWENGKGRPGKT